MSTSPRQLKTRAASRSAGSHGSRLGKAGQHQHPGQGRKARGHQERQPQPPIVGDRQAEQHPAQQRPQHKAQPEGHADQSHAPRPVLGRRHVGHIGLGNQDVPARGAVEHPGQQHDREVAGKPRIRNESAVPAWLKIKSGRRP